MTNAHHAIVIYKTHDDGPRQRIGILQGLDKATAETICEAMSLINVETIPCVAGWSPVGKYLIPIGELQYLADEIISRKK